MDTTYLNTAVRSDVDFAGPGSIGGSPHWLGAVQAQLRNNSVLQTPLPQLTTRMHVANKANAVLLVVTGALGIVNLFGDFLSLFSSVLESIYTLGFGALLLRHELGVETDEIRARYGFMFTFAGRAGFLLLVGNLAWAVKPIGWVTALLTNANAVFNLYLLYAHPDHIAGRSGSVAGRAGGGYAGMQVDPATAAARATYQDEIL